MELNKIDVVTDHKHLQIREIIQVPRLDEDGNPVFYQVEKVDKDGSPVLDNKGEPILIDGEQIIDAGGYHRRVLSPNVDVSKETQTLQRGIDEDGNPIMKTVKEIAEELWTDEVKSAYTTFQAEQEALHNP